MKKGKGFSEWITKVSVELSGALGLCEIKLSRVDFKSFLAKWMHLCSCNKLRVVE